MAGQGGAAAPPPPMRAPRRTAPVGRWRRRPLTWGAAASRRPGPADSAEAGGLASPHGGGAGDGHAGQPGAAGGRGLAAPDSGPPLRRPEGERAAGPQAAVRERSPPAFKAAGSHGGGSAVLSPKRSPPRLHACSPAAVQPCRLPAGATHPCTGLGLRGGPGAALGDPPSSLRPLARRRGSGGTDWKETARSWLKADGSFIPF